MSGTWMGHVTCRCCIHLVKGAMLFDVLPSTLGGVGEDIVPTKFVTKWCAKFDAHKLQDTLEASVLRCTDVTLPISKPRVVQMPENH